MGHPRAINPKEDADVLGNGDGLRKLALALGFILVRIYQIRCDELAGRDGGFTAPPVARIPRP
jgi:hypothetical protein